jgi:zinc/manganese transport system substrate-binding protein
MTVQHTVLRLVAAVLVFAGSLFAQSDTLNVVATLPTLRAFVEEVGGERVSVIALARGDQDPHFVRPTPVLMQRTREAALFVENGFSLERWADEVANGSGNSRIFRGTPGRVVAGEGITALEIPSVLSRELGDIHPLGNPHVWLDPLMAKAEAANIARALTRLDPEGAAYYTERQEDFARRIDVALFGDELLDMVGTQALTRLVWNGGLYDFLANNEFRSEPLINRLGGWLEQAEALRGAKAYEFHKVWVYFARVFGMELVGTIEEQPGIPPGPRHVREVTERIRSESIPLILVDNFYDPSLPNNIALEAGGQVRVVVLPNQVNGEPGIDNYFELMDYVISSLTEALN